jgi:hypothetical protein
MNVIDSRTVLDFQKFTFSGHLRQHVYKVLNENVKLGHADYACYWALELLCSGLVHSMWQTLFESAALHINRAAPNSFLYLIRMYEKFAPYESQYATMHMTDIRNNIEVRTIICEAAASITLCRKHKLPPLPKIKPEHDFLPLTIQENLKSPSANYGRELTKNDDPLEIYIPFIYYHRNTGDTLGALFTMDETDYYIRPLSDTTGSRFVLKYRYLLDEKGYKVGKVFVNNKIVVFDDQELVALLDYRSNRRYTLPAPKLGLVQSDGVAEYTMLSTTGSTAWVTYMFEDTNNKIFNSFPCNYFNKIKRDIKRVH